MGAKKRYFLFTFVLHGNLDLSNCLDMCCEEKMRGHNCMRARVLVSERLCKRGKCLVPLSGWLSLKVRYNIKAYQCKLWFWMF